MLKKKYTIQKSIRIDAQLSEDLERLSKLLDRPQSELINMAIENLIHDNSLWFVKYIFVDALSGVLEGRTEGESCSLGGVKIDLSVIDDKYYFKSTISDGCGIIDGLEDVYDDTPEAYEKIIRMLISLSDYLDRNSNEVQKYLAARLDYK